MNDTPSIDTEAVAAEICTMETEAAIATKLHILLEQNVQRKKIGKILSTVLRTGDRAVIERTYAASSGLIDQGFRNALAAEALGRIGQTEEAIAILEADFKGSEEDILFQRRRMELMQQFGRTDEVERSFERMIQRGTQGFDQLLSVLHNCIEAKDLTFAETLWENMKTRGHADDKKIAAVEKKLFLKFGPNAFESPTTVEKVRPGDSQAILNKYLDLLQSTAVPDEGMFGLCISIAKKLPKALSEPLWAAIIARDPARQKNYDAFKKMQTAPKAKESKALIAQRAERKKKREIPQVTGTGPIESHPEDKSAPTAYRLENLKGGLPRGDEKTLEASQKIALIRLATAAGRDGGETREIFEKLINSLTTSEAINKQERTILQRKLEESIEIHHRSDDNNQEISAARSRVFQKAFPKKPTFQTRQTRSVMTGSEFVDYEHPTH